MLNFPGLRGLADVRGIGPHARTPGPIKEKETDKVLLSLRSLPSSSSSSSIAGNQVKPCMQDFYMKLGKEELTSFTLKWVQKLDSFKELSESIWTRLIWYHFLWNCGLFSNIRKISAVSVKQKISKWGGRNAMLLFKRSKPHVDIRKWSAGTHYVKFCILKPWLKVC